MGAAFRAEWIKFRSLRSLVGLDLAAAVVTLAITYLHCRGYHLGSTDNAAGISMFGITLGMFFAGLAGALLATSEHASGTSPPPSPRSRAAAGSPRPRPP
jgi:hypothetical protein